MHAIAPIFDREHAAGNASFAPVISGIAGDERINRGPTVKPSIERQYDKYDTKAQFPFGEPRPNQGVEALSPSIGARLSEAPHVRS